MVNTGGVIWQVERVSATTYNALGATSPPPTGAISFEVPTTGTIEEIGRASAELSQGIWFNLPHMMDDAGVTLAANRLVASTTSGTKVRLELSNECWNFGFTQTFYFDGLGRVNGTSLTTEYARRAAQVHKLWLDVYTAAGRAADLVRVVAWQAYGPASGKDVLDAYKAWCVAHSYSFSAPHEYAVTNYFSGSDPGTGSDTASTRFRDFLLNGSDDPVPLSAAGLIDFAAYDLYNGSTGCLSAATASAAMVTTWNSVNTASVDIITYEGSQSMSGAAYSFSGMTSGDGPNYSGSAGTSGAGLMMSLAYARANRHPRIAYAQLGSIKQCLDLGYTAWSQFGTLSMWGQYGYWSDSEYYNQPIGNGESNLADLDNIVGAEVPKLYAELQWINT